MQLLPKLFIILGLSLIFIGTLWHFGGKYFHLGSLPGDLKIEKENFKLYFPLGTSLILSIILTLLFWLISYTKK